MASFGQSRNKLLAELWANVQDILQRDWWAQEAALPLSTMVLALGAATLLLLLALLRYIGWLQKRRRTHAMLVAVNDATFGRCIPRSRTGAWGFAVSVEPPPDRFREFNISYQPMSIIDPVDLLRFCFGGRRTLLQIAGNFEDAPTAELIWMRGQPPARTLGVNPGRAPWVQARLDYIGVEYATRGSNVAAMKHAFQDLIARFAPMVRSITVQRERRPQLRLVAAGRLEMRDISPLITAARALGRAAMLE